MKSIFTDFHCGIPYALVYRTESRKIQLVTKTHSLIEMKKDLFQYYFVFFFVNVHRCPLCGIRQDSGGVSTRRSVEEEIPPMPVFTLSNLIMKSKKILRMFHEGFLHRK